MVNVPRKYIPYLYVAPAIIYLLTFSIFPLIFSLNLSFRKYYFVRPELGQPFVGLSNYIQILTDPSALNALKVTLIFTFGAVAIETLIGLGLALFFDRFRQMRGAALIRTALLTPMFIPPVVIGVMFRFLFNPDVSVVNYLLRVVGLPSVGWISRADTAMFSIVLIDVWEWTPFIFLMLLAGLQSLPRDQFEAAKVDGASPWGTFRYVTLPMLMPALIVTILVRIIDAIRTFDYITILTYGGPGESTMIYSLYIYILNYKYNQMGLACAASFILLIVVTLITNLYVKLISKKYEI